MENLGPNATLVLDATDRSYTRVIFQPLRPPLNQEFNLVQDLINDEIQNIASSTFQSGFIQVGSLSGMPLGNTSDLWANVIKIVNPYCIINGHFLYVGGGTNQFQPNTTSTIWALLSGQDSESVFILPPVPATGSRDDLVFLEVWEERLTPQSNIVKYGNSQYGGTNYSNDLIDPNVKKETTERTQLKYRLRSAIGIDFISFREGINDPSVFAQGAMSTQSTYLFTKTPQGHYIAGNGDAASIAALGTVDGHSYAIPIAAVHRKNSTAFNNITNPNGSATIIDQLVSDRPDGTFQDQIAQDDIEDLRHVIFPNQSDAQILQQNIDLLINSTPNRLILGDDPSLFSNTDLQVDSIAATGTTGQGTNTLYRRPNNYQRSFAENEIAQRTVYFDQAPVLNGQGYYEIVPPIFYTISDTLNYQSLNPFVGGVLQPVIRNGTTRAVIPGNITAGINGWVNLGDRLNKAPAQFLPLHATDITTAGTLIVEYDLVIPAGTGFSQVPTQILSIFDNVNDLPVQYTPGNTPVTTTLSRVVNGFADTQTVLSVYNFLNPDNVLNETYTPGAIVRVYNMAGNRTSSITIPFEIDNNPVLSVYRVQNAATLADITLGLAGNNKILLNADGSLTINFSSFFPGPTETVSVTVLLQGTMVQPAVQNSGIQNFLKSQYLVVTTTGNTTYQITPAQNPNKIEWVYGVGGLQESTGLSYACFVGPATGPGILNQDFTVAGIGTDTLTLTFNPAPAAGQLLTIPLIGSYAPLLSDQYTITYDYVPYQGLSNLLSVGQTMQAEVVYLSDKALVSTNGTGGGPFSNVSASSVQFPINSTDADYLFENKPVPTPRDQAVSTIKYLDYQYDYAPTTSFLKPGDILTLTKQAMGALTYPARGCSLNTPNISYRVENLVFPVTQNVSNQTTGTSQSYNLKYPVMNVYGTYTVATNYGLQGTATFNSGERSILGAGAAFTSQLVSGCFIRPVNTTTWYQVQSVQSDTNATLQNVYPGATITTAFEIFLPNIQVFQNGNLLAPNAFTAVLGKEGIIALNFAPATTDVITVNYTTGLNTMNALYGLAKGVGGTLNGELLMFVLTTTSCVEFVNTPEFNEQALGTANSLIFNNTVSIDNTTGSTNEGNRVVIAADFFYTKFRRLNQSQT